MTFTWGKIAPALSFCYNGQGRQWLKNNPTKHNLFKKPHNSHSHLNQQKGKVQWLCTYFLYSLWSGITIFFCYRAQYLQCQTVTPSPAFLFCLHRSSVQSFHQRQVKCVSLVLSLTYKPYVKCAPYVRGLFAQKTFDKHGKKKIFQFKIL